MKLTSIPFLFILLLITFSCSKQEDCDNPVDCLPTPTQTGANTAGCLVNGEILVPSGQSLNSGSILLAQYIYEQNEYLFTITIRDRDNNKLVQLRTGDIELVEGEKYVLEKETDTTNSASFIIGGAGSGVGYITTDQETGELEITKLDKSQNIISGTFWFDAVNNQEEIVEVRNGRFDVTF